MKDHGFVEEREYASAKDIITKKNGQDKLFTIPCNMLVEEAIKILNKEGISQIPVQKNEEIVGSLTDSHILKQLIENPDLKKKEVSDLMDKPFPFVAEDTTLDVMSSMISKENQALLIRDSEKKIHIITQHDILMAMRGHWKLPWSEGEEILAPGDTGAVLPGLEYNVQPSMSGEASLFRVRNTDDPAGDTHWL